MRGLLAALLVSVPAVAFAQAADGAAGLPPQSPYMTLIPFAGVLVLIYFVLIVPQQRRMKEHQTKLGALKKGDEVVTGGGVVGKITKIDAAGDTITVEIAKGVEVTVLKATLNGPRSVPQAPVTEKKKGDKDKKNDNSVPSRSSVANDN